jgi:hypothetical protein
MINLASLGRVDTLCKNIMEFHILFFLHYIEMGLLTFPSVESVEIKSRISIE